MVKHHLSGTRVYQIRKGMLKRCFNKNHKSYADYGGRGVSVCDEWANAKDGAVNFYNWAMNNGYQDGLTIDRIDTNGNYCPDNCRWVTRQTQSWNTRPPKNKTGFVGVHFGKDGKFQAQITVANKTYGLGTFSTAQEASEAYKKAKRLRDDGKWESSPYFRLWG
jgi:hypothetical protein